MDTEKFYCYKITLSVAFKPLRSLAVSLKSRKYFNLLQNCYKFKMIFVMLVSLIVMLLKAEVCLPLSHDFFFVVHCEPLDSSLIEISFKKGLRPLIRMANNYGIKLTISLSPQWAAYILNDTRLLREIKDWLRHGHEIGILHYGLHHKPTWDYYTNENDPQRIIKAEQDPRKKIGSMADLIYKVNGVLLSEIVQSEPARQLSMNASDYEKDIFPGIPIHFITDGYRISSDPFQQDVIKKPEKISINGSTFWRLSLGYFSAIPLTDGAGWPGVGQIIHSLSTVYDFLKTSFMGEDMPGEKCDLSCFKLSLRYFTTLRPRDCEKAQVLNNLFLLYDLLKDSLLMKDDREYTFGLATHPLDFIADNPVNGGCGNFEKLFAFVNGKANKHQLSSKTVSRVLELRWR
jgi:hypothetical protein